LIITRCPNCHSRFRVTEGQLRLADGQVRCGACLRVFSAPEHAINPPREAPDTPSETPDRAPVFSGEEASVIPPAGAGEPASVPEEPAQPTAQTVSATDETAATENRVTDQRPAAPASKPVQPPLARFRTDQPLVAEPLHLSHTDDERNPVATAFILLGILLSLALLLFQLLWFERARLARYPQLQGFYSLLCHQVNCDLDSHEALDLIRNRSLHIQPHPQYADAIKVSVVLENTAPFAQPWPDLHLRFTDLRGRDVAQRVFQPDDYLDTRSLSTARMLPGQPMQIELELAAPAPRGVNYELRLTAPVRQP